MKYYPIFLDIRERKCLVVGGGEVGTRKIDTLISCGASVIVVSPEASDRIQQLAQEGRIRLILRPYQSGDMNGIFLVFAATNDPVLNRKISEDAAQCNILQNVADGPEDSSFIVPSVVDRGDLLMAISTSGKSPALARKIRKKLESDFGMEYALFLKLLGNVRKHLLIESRDPNAHKQIFEKLVYSALPEMIKEEKVMEINKLLSDILGPGFDYRALTNQNPQIDLTEKERLQQKSR